ncbi:MAG: tetratricopeptide repeat protein [Tepidisphaeraceae bacterium]
MTNQGLFDLAMQHQQAGRLREAQTLYQQHLASHPDDGQATQLLGLVHLHLGQAPEALELLNRAAELDPQAPDRHCHLGMALLALSRPDEAAGALQRALALKPDYLDAWYHLAHALHAAGRLDEAVAAYRRTLELRPQFPTVHNDMGAALAAQGRYDQAVVAFQTALSQRPQYPEALNNLDEALVQQGKWAEAVAVSRQIVAMQPDSAEVHDRLAVELARAGWLEESVRSAEKAVSLRPDFAEGHNTLGMSLAKLGRLEQAKATLQRALALKPDLSSARFNLSLIYLVQGDWQRGWREFEWRWRVLKPYMPEPQFSQLMWDGGDLAGRRILLHPEGGYGDSIQFVRYVPLLARGGGKVVLACVPELQRLFQTVDGVDELAITAPSMPPFHVHCPLLSLPRLLKTSLHNIPAKVPYLRADAAQSRRWRAMLPAGKELLKVGLAWAGRPEYDDDRRRSTSLSNLAPLGQVEGVWFCSLQKGPAAQQVRALPAGFEVTDLSADLNDFADTAALIDNLDLVIAVDTAAAHLAGALAKPTWVLLPKVPDWRWMLNRDDSLWYPTMRLFRQPIAGDWDTPIRRIVEALRSLRQA